MLTIIGYVYSKKDKKLVAIERKENIEINLEEKLFSYFNEQIKNKFLKGE